MFLEYLVQAIRKDYVAKKVNLESDGKNTNRFQAADRTDGISYLPSRRR